MLAGMSAPAAIELKDVVVRFGQLKAVDGVSFAAGKGETMGIVGESGCGKTTLAKAMVGLHPMAAGTMSLAGKEVEARERASLARRVQLLFQDPVASLSPRMTVGDLIAEPLLIRKADTPDQRARLDHLIESLGLPSDIATRYAHQLSGGQARRVSLVRALAMEPQTLIADEPTAGLDLSVQGDVLNLIMGVQRDFHLTTILISHNLNVVGRVTQRVAIMYLGRIVEIGDTQAVFRRPAHPYTAALLSANPVLRGRGARPRIILAGEQPSPLAPPPGCRFHTRCPIARPRCRVDVPPLVAKDGDRDAACHYPFEIGTAAQGATGRPA